MKPYTKLSGQRGKVEQNLMSRPCACVQRRNIKTVDNKETELDKVIAYKYTFFVNTYKTVSNSFEMIVHNKQYYSEQLTQSQLPLQADRFTAAVTNEMRCARSYKFICQFE